MERRLKLQGLRGMDPITLQVTIADAIRRPMRQLEPTALMELMALAGASGVEPKIAKDMVAFAARIAKEVSDIPEGSSWVEFLSEIGEVAPAMTPDLFRNLLKKELEARGDTDVSAAEVVLGAWDGVEAAEFVVGTGEANIQRSTRVAKPRGGGENTPTPRRTAKRISRTKEVDPIRQKFIRDICVERLQGYLENGLSEKILVTGVSFTARKTYKNISPAEVVAVLKTLEDEGLAKRSAGRWTLGRVW